VGLHELLGHGSGKLFYAGDAELVKTLTNPLTGEVGGLSTYPENSTWDTSFGKIASNYEECRAECTGIYLCLQPTILEVFGHTTEEAQNDIIYINWLLMVRAGVVALEFYTPSTDAWRQAHMNARYVILRVLLEAGQGLVYLERTTGEDGAEDVRVHLDRDKIATVGKTAIAAFMLRLQMYKSTGGT
jgi:dipeptidyl-peptidase III